VNLVTRSKQDVDGMRADEASGAGEQYATHGAWWE
jgi:hypothetical protein